MEKIKDISEEAQTAQKLLTGNNITLIDTARLIKNILDFMPKGPNLTEIQFCTKIIETGKVHFRTNEMSFKDGFNLYYETKKDILRPDSLRDIRYLGNRLLRAKPELGRRNFSELSRSNCEDWLNDTFSTPSQFKRSANEISPQAKDSQRAKTSEARLDALEVHPEGARVSSQTTHKVSASQFNKGRSFLHAIFEFAIRREWCDKNPIKQIERKKIIEKEIKPLSLEETKILLKNAKKKNCTEVVGLMMLAGIRPKEAKRLEWRDIDLDDNSIKIRSICSKTGGIRHVEICPKLKNILLERETEFLSPRNWPKKWKQIRDNSGFKGLWVQDVLRHTYASYFTKRYSDLPRLQLNMGHRDLSLLRSRYVNMQNISKADAKEFFG